MHSDFQLYSKRVKGPLAAAFAEVVGALLTGIDPFGSFSDGSNLPSGKMIRGALLCLVHETLGGALQEAVPCALAIEMIHTASLIHDDFVDRHPFRRNHPALWTVEGGRRAVLLGDVIFASAIRMMSERGRHESRIVSEAIAEVALGAYQEPLSPAMLLKLLEAGRVPGGFYEKIIYLKTAILFGAACELGALCAGAEERVRGGWRHYGLRIGEGYQIADDLQEVEKALLDGGISADELTALAPPLLHFSEDLVPHVVEGLRLGRLEVRGEVRCRFLRAAERMRCERERRLQGAVASVAGWLPEKRDASLVLQAPQELIRLFDASARECAAP